jgi:gamma-glutamyl-gamma-aminobutyrate hydrolase PuuD
MTRSSGAEAPPRIALSTYREPAAWGVWNQPADLLPTRYTDSVRAAGGVALLLPPGAAHPSRDAVAALHEIHGLVLAGGADVDPARYHADRDPHTGSPRPDRDEWEIVLAREALQRGLPLLAICRGMQVLNVTLGGDLVQHLPDLLGSDRHCPVVGEHGRHSVKFAAGSRVGTMFGSATTVATYHHQAINRVGADLVPTGWATDGTVEALEHTRADWVVAVQWHPEVHDGAALFNGFVSAAADYRSRLSVSA